MSGVIGWRRGQRLLTQGEEDDGVQSTETASMGRSHVEAGDQQVTASVRSLWGARFCTHEGFYVVGRVGGRM